VPDYSIVVWRTDGGWQSKEFDKKDNQMSEGTSPARPEQIG